MEGCVVECFVLIDFWQRSEGGYLRFYSFEIAEV